MAVKTEPSAQARTASSGRKLLLGTNVAVAIVLAVAIVVIVQMIGYTADHRWDLTSTGINSLSDATESMVEKLDRNIRLTSLYFETDREDEDQQRYRQAARNLIELYESTNRSKITAEWINPLKDHEKIRNLVARLREKPAFKMGIAAYTERIEAYREKLDAAMRGLIQADLDQVAALGGGIGGGAGAVARLDPILTQWSSNLQRLRDSVDSWMRDENPQYALATRELRALYTSFRDQFQDIAAFGRREAEGNPNAREFLSGAGARYAPVVADLEAEITRLDELEPLEFSDILEEIGPGQTRNALLVETDEEARVVDFSDVWPPLDEAAMGTQTPFERRAFKGEDKLTAAILRCTHKEQPAVIFVRHGGSSIFFNMNLSQMRTPPPFQAMKEHLENANFVVEEWDLKTSDTPPAIDPPPTRTIYVVLQPNADPENPMGMPPDGQVFSEKHLQLVRDAIGENGRALFIAGWQPGPGNLPAKYEYKQLIREMWGIHISTEMLLIETVSTAPGQYRVVRQSFDWMDGVEFGDHVIVQGIRSLHVALPSCAPLKIAEPKEGVEYHTLLTQPKEDGVWAVMNLQRYADQLNERDYLTRVESDWEGPFTLAYAVEKGDAKAVVISSRGFAIDGIAFQKEMALTPSGISVRHANPGNSALFINSLHWLNDNTEFMNIGSPIDTAVLKVEKSTIKKVQALTILVWPALALCCGGIAWWVRRR